VDPRTSVGDECDIALDAATSSEGAHGTDLESEIPMFEEEVDGNCMCLPTLPLFCSHYWCFCSASVQVELLDI
jgi:hypothetical protein